MTTMTAGGEWLSNAIMTVIVIALGLTASYFVTRLIRFVFSKSSLSGATIVTNVTRVLIALMVVNIVGENVFGLELTGLAQALGVTTLVVTLGLQDLIKNVVAGMQILMTHLFVAGDHLVVDGERGEVIDVNWRQTSLRDKDGNPFVIPNAKIMEGRFTRLDGKTARRYIITCDIKPGLDLQRVAADIQQLADETLAQHGWKAEETTEVRFMGSTANGVAASIRIFLSDIEFTTQGMDHVMRAIGQRGYLADWTNESPLQEQWR